MRRPLKRRREQGFTLAGLLVILTILAVVVAYTLPRMWSDVMRRERDIQTIWVMKQYARAIRDFQIRRGALPTSLKELADQNNPRVLRRLHPDPLTGELDWILITPGSQAPVTQPARPGERPPVGAPIGEPIGKPIGKPLEGATGPFTGVRPPVTGESMLELRGATQYEEWSYTVADLLTDTGAAAAPAAAPPPGQTPPPPKP